MRVTGCLLPLTNLGRMAKYRDKISPKRSTGAEARQNEMCVPYFAQDPRELSAMSTVLSGPRYTAGHCERCDSSMSETVNRQDT